MKLCIVDTQGPAGLSDAYRALLPGVTITGYEPAAVAGQPCHPHGAMCGWLAALPCIAAGLPLELAFVRCFDSRPAWIPGADAFILERLAEIRPDYVSRSWGAWDGDDDLTRYLAQSAYIEFARAYAPMIGPGGIADFGAAGNDDTNDRDDDVAYPQCLLPRCNIIGAHDRRGVPCKWSGDGKGVLCCMWADRIWSPDAAGAWHLWSGTSAACPKACGLAAYHGLGTHGWRERVIGGASRPIEPHELPHAKYGWGSMEWDYQRAIERLPIGLLPPRPPARSVPLAMHDYRSLA